MSRTKKIGKNKQLLEQKVQLGLLEQYFAEYSLMNHYQQWLNSRLAKDKMVKKPSGLNWKIFFNPILKLFRKK